MAYQMQIIVAAVEDAVIQPETVLKNVWKGALE
jgi:hypothetical protein